ncbi:hypothetical protein PPACK8108_LOCUS13654, partial [Phakopsora pachyrhizi]
IREVVSKRILTFSKPFSRFGVLPIGGRSTAIKLSDSSVWLLASTPLSDETKDSLNDFGPVKYVALADIEHTSFAKEYRLAYPEAKFFGPEGVSEKLGFKVFEWKADGQNPMKTHASDTLGSEIKAEYFGGFRNKDIAFLHVPTKTLVQADLVFNLPGNEQYSKSNSSPTNFLSYFISFHPDSFFHKNLLYRLAERKSMAKSATVVDQWDFDRIIPCHGDVIETGGKSAWRRAFSYYFS